MSEDSTHATELAERDARIAQLRIELEQTRKAEVEARRHDAHQLNEIESMQAIIRERDATIIAFQTRVTELRHDLNMMIDQRNAANAHIAELEAAQAWVSVDERLPEPLDDVIVTDGDSITVGWASAHGSWNLTGWSGEGITHWMPLPPPPVTP